jgi:hypothetical protein
MLEYWTIVLVCSIPLLLVVGLYFYDREREREDRVKKLEERVKELEERE